MVPFVLVTTLFFLWGFARAILDILNKHFQNELNISITQSSLIQVTTYLGYFLMAIPAGLFINRWGYRRGVVFGLCLFGAGSLLFIPGAYMGTFNAFLLCLFIIGCGLTFLETAANPYVTELGAPETSTSRLNLSQSFNGLGSLFATFVVGQFFFSTESSGDVVVPYSILGALVLLIAVIFAHVPLPEINLNTTKDEATEHTPPPSQRGGGEGETGLGNLRELFAHHPMFVFGLFALLAYEVAEISINSYLCHRHRGEHLACAAEHRPSVALCLVGQLFLRGHHVPHHFLAGPRRRGTSHQECLIATDDDPRGRLRLPADGLCGRSHQPHHAVPHPACRLRSNPGVCLGVEQEKFDRQRVRSWLLQKKLLWSLTLHRFSNVQKNCFLQNLNKKDEEKDCFAGCVYFTANALHGAAAQLFHQRHLCR